MISSTSSSATVSTGIYPNGEDTTYWVEYGPTTAYGNSTTPVDVGSGTSLASVSQTLSGLSSSSYYHYRIDGSNASGTTYGYDYTLSTSTTPLDVTAPSISGTDADGSTLTASPGTWAASSGSVSYTYQWQLCNSGGSGCSNVSGATSQTFALSGADVGLTLDVTVHAHTTGTGAATSAATPQISGNAPSIASSWTPVSAPSPHPFASANGLYGLSCPSTSLCVTGDAQGNILTSTDPTDTTPTWASVPVALKGVITTVSCPSTSLCLAGGPGIAGIAVTTDPTGPASGWSVTATDGGAHVTAISCPSTSLCVANDINGSTLYSTSPTSGTWATSSAPGFFAYGISCPTTSLCVAVSFQAKIMTSTNPTGGSGSWHVLTGFSQGLLGVSCTESPSLLCIATGDNGGIFASTNPTGTLSAWSLSAADGSNQMYAASCYSTSLCLAGDSAGDIISSANPTAATPTWSVAHMDGNNTVNGAYCLTSSSCLAIDSGGNVLTSAAPTTSSWGVTSVAGEDNYYSISCPSASFCASVDQNGNVITSASPSSGWQVTNIDSSSVMVGISCPSSAFCAAVDINGDVIVSTDPSGNSPADWHLTSISGNPLTSIDCVSSSLCLASDGGGNILYSTAPASGTWHIISADANAINSISCSSLSFCVAVDAFGDVLYSTAPTSSWSAPVTVDTNALTSVSCPTTSFCAASDSFGAIVTSTDPTSASWTVSPVDGGNSIYSISCPAASSCTAIDNGGNVLTSSDPTGSWAVANAYGGGYYPANGLYSISCPATTFCVASGNTPEVMVGAASLPVVSGTAADGQTLSTTTGTWNGSTPITYTYQWERCDGSGLSCTSISGATSTTYQLTGSDVGHTVEAVVTATNSTNGTSTSSNLTGVVADVAPVSTEAPVVTGTATDGQALTTTTGIFSGDNLTYAYQWQRCDPSGSNCSSLGSADGAQTSTYTLQNSDVGQTVEASVTAVNGSGSATGTSSSTGQVANVIPSNVTAPTISGTPNVTSSLSGSGDAWLGAQVTDNYQWQDCSSPSDPTTCADIPGASGTTSVPSYSYSPVSADVGGYIRVGVWASDSAGGTSADIAYSAETPSYVAGTAPGTPSTPVLSNTAPAYDASAISIASGGTSTAGVPSTTAYAYDWQRCTAPDCGTSSGNTAITVGASSTYTPSSADVGYYLRVQVMASNSQGAYTGTSAATSSAVTSYVAGEVAGDPSTPTLSDTAPAYDSSAISISSGGTSSPGLPAATTYTYDWQRCTASDCSTGSGNTTTSVGSSATYTPSSADIGYYLRAQVTATDSQGAYTGTSATTSSAATAFVTGSAPTPPSTPSIPDTPSYAVSQLSSAGTGSAGVPTPSYSYQWQDCTSTSVSSCADIANATAQSYTPVGSDIGDYLRVGVSSSDSAGQWAGISSTAYSAESTSAVAGTGPTNTVLPVISGTLADGQTLTTTNGTWTGTPTPAYSYQWQRCASASTSSCADIGGATSESYTPASGDVGSYLRVGVTATNTTGAWTGASATEHSSESANYVTGTPPGAPSIPVLSDAAPAYDSGAISIASGGTSTAGVPSTTAYAYDWQRCTAPDCGTSSGNTATSVGSSGTYTPSSSDVGYYLQVQVTASNAQGAWTGTSATTSSAVTAYVTGAAPGQPATPTLSTGSPTEGVALSTSAAAGASPGMPSSTAYSYQWQRCASISASSCSDVSGATSQSYTPASGDVGSYLRVGVTAANGHWAYAGRSPVGNSAETTVPVASPSNPPSQAPANVSPPVVSGTAHVGDVLSTSNGSFTGAVLAYAYQWQGSNDGGATWQDIPGSTGPSYALQAADAGHIIRSEVTATDSGGSAVGVSSPTGQVALSTPPITQLRLALKVGPTSFTGKTYKRVKLAYILSDAATIHISLRREESGHQAGKKCLGGAPSRRGAKRCLLLGRPQAFRITGIPGAQSEALAKVIKKACFRSAGTYLLTATATATGYASGKAQAVVAVR